MSNIDIALDIAVEAHKGQLDKSGQKYINHPFRISLQMDTEEEKIVALLHDVLEDSKLTPVDLINYGFSYNVITAVNLLTRGEESYKNYIKAIKDDKLATKVKIADLLDNINLSRLSSISVKDINRTRKYLDALEYLISE